MASINDIYIGLKNIENAISIKGGEVIKANANPSLSELVKGINSINTAPKAEIINTQASKLAITAELPNITINLKDSDGNIVDTKDTGVQGGRVELEFTNAGIYTVEAYDVNNEKIWDNEFEANPDKNTYYVKSGKKFNDYEWSEIKQASNGHYAKYMWSIGDKKVLKEWLGIDLTNCPSDSDPSTSYHTVDIISFEHDTKVSDGTRAGITLRLTNKSGLGYDYYGAYYTTMPESNYAFSASNYTHTGYLSYYSKFPHGIYMTNTSYIQYIWPVVYDAQKNPDTTISRETFPKYFDGSILDKQSLIIIIPFYMYNNYGNNSNTGKMSTTSQYHLRFNDFYFNGVPYKNNETYGKLYPYLGYSSFTPSDINSTSAATRFNTYRQNWLTGPLRFYCLPKGSTMYMMPHYDVTSSTSGTFYKWDTSSKSFIEVSLPQEYVSTDTYFEKYTLTDDGPILKSFPEELRNIMEKVKKITVAPYFDSATNLSTSPYTVETEDFLYLPSMDEVFGYAQPVKEPLPELQNLRKYSQTINKYILNAGENIEGECFFNPKEDNYSNYWMFRSSIQHGYGNVRYNANLEIESVDRSYYTPPCFYQSNITLYGSDEGGLNSNYSTIYYVNSAGTNTSTTDGRWYYPYYYVNNSNRVYQSQYYDRFADKLVDINGRYAYGTEGTSAGRFSYCFAI